MYVYLIVRQALYTYACLAVQIEDWSYYDYIPILVNLQNNYILFILLTMSMCIIAVFQL